jgi:hypothetical protein
MRLPVVDATLTVLVFLECPMRAGEAFEPSLVCLTIPSAMRFLDCPPFTSVVTFCRAAASSDNCISWESWLDEALPLPGPALAPLSLPVGVKTRSVSVVSVVACDSLPESLTWCIWLPATLGGRDTGALSRRVLMVRRP